ncbi:MAG TPA: hypothetical protein VMD92_11980 [Acidobacteriaceae bacterium]|jgi:hypothetical protein|nr:hypothetical protein [Acidobacteriaceae bacterium]
MQFRPKPMRLWPRMGCAIGAAFTCALPLLASQGAKPAEFPSITSYSLDKQKVALPGGMEGQTDLLILSFALEQKKDVDSWLPAAQALQHSNFQFRYYQLPIFTRENFVFRWWETSSMRSDETDPVTWHWIVPLFVDREKFRRDLDIPNDKQVVVLLADRQGRILWRASGPMTDDKRASLMQAAGQH